MIDLEELNLNNDMQRFTERLMGEIENIKDEADVIKLFRECVEYNEYDEITEVMIDGDYIESALSWGGYGFKAIPYLKDYDLIEGDIEAVLESLEKEEREKDKFYQILDWIKNNFMKCDFIRKFYPECEQMDYTPENLFERAANLEELGHELETRGITELNNKQEYVHKLIEDKDRDEIRNFDAILSVLKEEEIEFER